MAKRKWTIMRHDFDYEDAFRAAVSEEHARHEHVGHRIGLGLVSSPLRHRGEDGEITTLGWVFRTETIPLITDEQIARADEELPEIPVEPEPDDWEPAALEEPEPVTVPEGDPYAEDQ